ncbi:MAG: hypothetical protein HQL67_06530 [Magnetococcales bacterium]|nr:hypothetical protein [Magnetococcales bacterium]
MEASFSNKDVLGLQEGICEECNGTGKRLSLDLDEEFLDCDWCCGTGNMMPLESE